MNYITELCSLPNIQEYSAPFLLIIGKVILLFVSKHALIQSLPRNEQEPNPILLVEAPLVEPLNMNLVNTQYF